jgi:hypothetical protein
MSHAVSKETAMGDNPINIIDWGKTTVKDGWLTIRINSRHLCVRRVPLGGESRLKVLSSARDPNLHRGRYGYCSHSVMYRMLWNSCSHGHKLIHIPTNTLRLHGAKPEVRTRPSSLDSLGPNGPIEQRWMVLTSSLQHKVPLVKSPWEF